MWCKFQVEKKSEETRSISSWREENHSSVIRGMSEVQQNTSNSWEKKSILMSYLWASSFSNELITIYFHESSKHISHRLKLLEWTKISDLETTFFDLKVGVKSCLEFFILKFTEPLWPSEIPANLPGQSSLSRQMFLYWAAATFDRYYIGQKQGKDFAKRCGLLRIYEL